MNDRLFWILQEETKVESKNNLKSQLELLKKRLVELPDSALLEYEEAFRTWLHQCDRGPLADAMLIMYGYVSDDTFEDWRAALVMHGKKVVQDAIRDPDTLANQDYFEPLEQNLFLVLDEFERRYGLAKAEELRDSAQPELDWNIDGGEQSESVEEALKTYPRLTARFWEKYGRKQFERIYLKKPL
jgi:hypothetical protein